MEIWMHPSINSIPSPISQLNPRQIPNFSIIRRRRSDLTGRFDAFPANRSFSTPKSTRISIRSNSTPDLQRCKSNLETLFCYDKSIPEENIEKPVGLSLNSREIGTNPPCIDCQAKGATLCATCSGSGLYVDSILESQGVIVKVRCLGCGGTGNIMCSECGGRGHVGIN
ncbi:Uncharacterized protein M6B38_229290 [Iris pallida]|uniref:Uncharacterized protein n=1 Tax=Iris pallida TaxID=29817 RepID=A0AAX6DTB7_IRIPA|nr:Uncharacterized protein M6B38_229290 [Iris pallida]